MSSHAIPFARAFRPRDPHEPHRVASPLELFFDLVFVVAIASVGVYLHHALAEGHPEAGWNYLLVFLTIWWAWMNYSWYASAYDTDDVVYRLLTFVIMTGALIYAAGLPELFKSNMQSAVAVLGYAVMRFGMVGLWLRTAKGDPERRTTALAYASGITFVQVLWILRLTFPEAALLPTFLTFFALELLVPPIAERFGRTPYHPHHMAERYSLLVIIVLGEEILSIMGTVQTALTNGTPPQFGLLMLGGLLIVFSAWWWYFCENGADLLARRRSAWVFAYGHFFIFASLGAIGSALAAAVDVLAGEAHTSGTIVGLALAVCMSMYVAVTSGLQYLRTRQASVIVQCASLIVVLLLIALFVPNPAVAVALMGGAMAVSVAFYSRQDDVRTPESAATRLAATERPAGQTADGQELPGV